MELEEGLKVENAENPQEQEKKVVNPTEFMIVDVKPIYSVFMKRFARLRSFFGLNIMSSGFEFMDAEVIWAFEGMENQHLFELHNNDLVKLSNGTVWIVLKRHSSVVNNEAGNAEEHHILRMRLYNRSKHQYMRKSDINLLHGEGKKVGDVNFN